MTKDEMIEELSKFPSKDIRELAGVTDAECNERAVAAGDDFPAGDFVLGESGKGGKHPAKADPNSGMTSTFASEAENIHPFKSMKEDYEENRQQNAVHVASDLDTSKDNKVTYKVATVSQSEFETKKVSEISFKTKNARIGTKLSDLGDNVRVVGYIGFDSNPDIYYTKAVDTSSINGYPASYYFTTNYNQDRTYIADGAIVLIVTPDTEE